MANYNLDITLTKALKEYALKTPTDLTFTTGAEWLKDKFHLPYFNTEIEITYPKGEVIDLKTQQPLNIIEHILVLHYFIHAGGRTSSQKYISFKEIPGGNIYIEPFTKRSIRPFIKGFGDNLEKFETVAQLFGGVKQSFGDISYTFNVLPRIPITLVIWAGDDEFPPNANILFDESAIDYLPAEDYAWICSLLVGKLLTLARQC